MATLIVGAGPRLGGAVAAALGPAHGPVALIGRTSADVDPVVANLAAASVPSAGFCADITVDDELIAAIAAARGAVGPVDVVVFNPSLWVTGTPTTVRPEDFRAGLALGLTPALVTLQATVADLRANAPRSTLLFTGSEAALRYDPDAIALGIQKTGLRHLARATAQELRPDGVHVAIVTIRGTLAPEGAIDPQRAAASYADLATVGIERPTEVFVTEDGPDWRPGR